MLVVGSAGCGAVVVFRLCAGRSVFDLSSSSSNLLDQQEESTPSISQAMSLFFAHLPPFFCFPQLVFCGAQIRT